jgi:GntR family transcriptional repressor for pyruvate dehydrogenase complex
MTTEHIAPQPSTEIDGLAPIARQQVPEQVARKLQQFIATQRMRVGDRLASERELALALQVSRTALREGVKLLAAHGVVEVRPGIGAFVKEPQSTVLRDFSLLDSEERRHTLIQATSVRRLIDSEAAALAAELITDDGLAEIERYLNMADEEPMRTRLAFTLDLTFESMLGKASGNPYLIATQREAHRGFRAVWEGCGFIPRPAEDRSRHHWEIFEAIKARDSELARALMNTHVAPLMR